MTRRLMATNHNNRYVEMTMNPDSLSVHMDKRVSRLTMQEYLLLEALAQEPGRTLSRNNLLMDVWQCKEPIKTRTVDVHVQRLRRKLGPSLIETVHGVGYRLHATPLATALPQVG